MPERTTTTKATGIQAASTSHAETIVPRIAQHIFGEIRHKGKKEGAKRMRRGKSEHSLRLSIATSLALQTEQSLERWKQKQEDATITTSVASFLYFFKCSQIL